MVTKSLKGTPFDEEREAALAECLKARLVEAFESLRAGPAMEGTVSGGLLDRLRQKILTNLEVRVTNVHLRYEDHALDRVAPFVVGVQFEWLTYCTTDAEGRPSYVADPGAQSFAFKQIALEL